MVQLPRNVRLAIDARADAVPFSGPQTRRRQPLRRPIAKGAPTRLKSDLDITAYLGHPHARHYAAARAALAELPNLPIATVLDIAPAVDPPALAARDRFATARDITLVERDPSLADAAREWLPEARVHAADIATLRDLPAHDLVIARMRVAAARRAWLDRRLARRARRSRGAESDPARFTEARRVSGDHEIVRGQSRGGWRYRLRGRALREPLAGGVGE